MLQRLCAALSCLTALAAIPSSAATVPDPKLDETARAVKRETAVLAGGCFWGVEAVFRHVKGVTGVTSGYSGGDKKTAHGEMVETGKTAHAESVELTYDPAKITYGQLLKIFFSIVHDPTQLNRQGPDVGPQYRSIVFYKSDEQKSIAEAYIQQIEAEHVFPRKIVTQVQPFEAFYRAEEVHQDFSERNPSNPYVVEYDQPKLRALKDQFPDLYRSR